MTTYVLSSAARAALVDIYAYSIDTWGEAQADTYLDGLFARLDELAERREVWRPIPPEFGVAGHFARYEKHFIYWKVFDDGVIGVAAILHAAMLQGDRVRAAFGAGKEEA